MTRAPKTHLRELPPRRDDPERYRNGWTLCGRMEPTRVTEDTRAVSCTWCRRELVRLAQLRSDDHVSTGARPAVRGAHALDERLAAIVARSIGGDDATQRGYRWRSPTTAIASLVAFRVDGQPVRSTSATSRFEREPRGASDVMRPVAGLVDDLVGVADAVHRAYACERAFPESTDADGHTWPAATLTIAMQREVLLLSVAGSDGFEALSHARVCEIVEEQHRITLTENRVALVREAGVRAVAEHLRASGELAPAEQQGTDTTEADVKIPGYELSGWKMIAAHIDVSEAKARALSQRDSDPLPVHYVSDPRGVYASRAELDAWALRQLARRGAA